MRTAMWTVLAGGAVACLLFGWKGVWTYLLITVAAAAVLGTAVALALAARAAAVAVTRLRISVLPARGCEKVAAAYNAVGPHTITALSVVPVRLADAGVLSPPGPVPQPPGPVAGSGGRGLPEDLCQVSPDRLEPLAGRLLYAVVTPDSIRLWRRQGLLRYGETAAFDREWVWRIRRVDDGVGRLVLWTPEAGPPASYGGRVLELRAGSGSYLRFFLGYVG